MTDAKVYAETLELKITVNPVEVRIKRSQETWAYIYMMAGILVSIEGTVISMWPGVWWHRILSLFVMGSLSSWALIRSRWLQNRLVVIKEWTEQAR